ncbi:MAG: DUF4142 domain-containing protein [Chitinophagaceae bacterium]
MKKSIFYSGVFILIAAATSCGNNSSTDSATHAENANDAKIETSKEADSMAVSTIGVGQPDADFAVEAADGGMLEVQLGKMAQDKGVSSDVKALGAMMVKDHSAANAELMAVAKEKNITLPAVLSDKNQKTVASLTEKTGTEFDKAYSNYMVSDHKDDIDAFKKEANSGKDSTLTGWARNKVPVLEHHLMMAEKAKKTADKSK